MPINHLTSGGLIVNYKCPAACGHCMYGSSPYAEPGYMSEATAENICQHLRDMGCTSLHIGGGEPFLNTDGLKRVISVIRNNGIAIDYIETNAAWMTGNAEQDRRLLADVRQAGGECIMVSADPFHVEFIPFWKPLSLIRLLEETGTAYFVWQQLYISILSRLEPDKTYDAKELRQVLGYDVIGQCVREYGMGFNGRALNLLRKYAPKKKPDEWLDTIPCRSLYQTGHFHVDFLGRYIPPGCTGMGISIEDLPNELDPEQYPVMSRLFSRGTEGLWVYALSRGYKPEPDGYVSQCDLCYQLRKYLAANKPDIHPDITPASYYYQDY